MTKPTVSIVAVCYNHERYLVETLESIKTQTFADYELVIVDNGSSDQSALLIEQWKNENPDIIITFIELKNRIGLCKLLNDVLKVIQGAYLQMISCDDLLCPFKIEKHVAILKDLDETYALVFSDAILIDSNSKPHYARFISWAKPHLLDVPEGDIFNTLLEEGNFIPAMTCLIRLECIRSIGGYDEKLIYEDYDMWLRLSEKFQFQFDSELSAKYRIHSSNYHKSIVTKVDNFLIYFKFAKKNPPFVKEKLRNSLFAMYRQRYYKTLEFYSLYVVEFGEIPGFRMSYKLALPFSFFSRFIGH